MPPHTDGQHLQDPYVPQHERGDWIGNAERFKEPDLFGIFNRDLVRADFKVGVKRRHEPVPRDVRARIGVDLLAEAADILPAYAEASRKLVAAVFFKQAAAVHKGIHKIEPFDAPPAAFPDLGAARIGRAVERNQD